MLALVLMVQNFSHGKMKAEGLFVMRANHESQTRINRKSQIGPVP